MKKIFIAFNIFLILFSVIFTLLAIQNHEGNIFYYLSYSILINGLLIYTLNTKRLFFEIYFAAFIWLGFWFKYTLSLVFLNGIIYDSGPSVNMTNIDKAILTSIIAISAVFFSFIFRNKFFKEKLYKVKKKSFFEKKYLENRKLVIFLFVVLFSLFAILNYNYSIYQKGFIYKNEISLILVNFTKWMLLFGFSTLSCFFIFTEILRLKKISLTLIIFAFFEIFFSYSSMLSRALIMNISVLTFSTSKYLNLIRNKKIFFFTLSILVIFMFVLNNYFSNHIRINFAQEIGNEIKNKKLNNNQVNENNKIDVNEIVKFKVSNDRKVRPDPINMTSFIIINRWSGIDSMIAVVSSKKLSFDLLFQSLKEKKTLNNKTFYETTFNVDYDGGKEVMIGKKRILKGNTLPGIISFLFYSGNHFFLFITIFTLTFLFSSLEIFCKNITNNNMIYASFISFIICFRLFNFGYAPQDTYLFIISVVFSVLSIFLLSRFNFFFLKKNNNMQ
jgi:hypothetical protein